MAQRDPSSSFGQFTLTPAAGATDEGAASLFSRIGSPYTQPPVVDGRRAPGESDSLFNPQGIRFTDTVRDHFMHKPSDTVTHNLTAPLVEQCGCVCNISRGLPIWVVSKRLDPDPYMANYYANKLKQLRSASNSNPKIIEKFEKYHNVYETVYKEEQRQHRNVDRIEEALVKRGWRFARDDAMVFTAPMVIKAFNDLADADVGNENVQQVSELSSSVNAEFLQAAFQASIGGDAADSVESEIVDQLSELRKKHNESLVSVFHRRLRFSGFSAASDFTSLAVANAGEMQIHNYFVRPIHNSMYNAAYGQNIAPVPSDTVGFWLKKTTYMRKGTPSLSGDSSSTSPSKAVKSYTLLPVFRKCGSSKYYYTWDETLATSLMATQAQAAAYGNSESLMSISPALKKQRPKIYSIPENWVTKGTVFEVGNVSTTKDTPWRPNMSNGQVLSTRPDPTMLLPIFRSGSVDSNNNTCYQQAHVHAATTVPNLYINIRMTKVKVNSDLEIPYNYTKLITTVGSSTVVAGDASITRTIEQLDNTANYTVNPRDRTKASQLTALAGKLWTKIKKYKEDISRNPKKSSTETIVLGQHAIKMVQLQQSLFIQAKNPSDERLKEIYTDAFGAESGSAESPAIQPEQQQVRRQAGAGSGPSSLLGNRNTT